MSKSLSLFYYTLCICIAAQTGKSFAQNQPDSKAISWSASWVSHPDISQSEYNVIHFRKEMSFDHKPDSFIIHISADNRYYLFINEKLVCFGPQLSDIRHWKYETLDIAPYLKTGKNIVAVKVVNWGLDRFFGIISLRTALIIQGNSEKEKSINTNDKDWKTFSNKSYTPKHPNWMQHIDIDGGFYASNPGDSIYANMYPWGWQNINYDDSHWKLPCWVSGASSWGGSFSWMLEPRTTPLLVMKPENFKSIIRTENILLPKGFVMGNTPVTVPSYTKASFLIDYKEMTMGFPQLTVSGGNFAEVKITYAENLVDKNRQRGNRNDIQGKHIMGLYDKYVLDGGANRMFSPLWIRSFRFIQVDIQTQKDPLILNSYKHVFTAAPLSMPATFTCDDPKYTRILDICTRTASICAQDNLYSDAYYEQMQYVGDSRVHALSLLHLTGDDVYLRNAIQQFNNSRMPDGMITSCYPLRATFVHPTFSLIWIDMLYDHMMYRGDKKLLTKYVENVRATLAWFKNHMQPNGLVGDNEYPYFVDWYIEKKAGNRVFNTEQGNSVTVTLHYLYSLQNAIEIFRFIGDNDQAFILQIQADNLKKTLFKKYFLPSKNMFTEDPDGTFADQRPNIMGILTGAIPDSLQDGVMKSILTDTSMSQAGLYYRYFLFMAMAKSNTGHRLKQSLQPWYTLLDNGLTTTTEVPLDNPAQRSEAHPWSTGPIHAFFTIVCGIRPERPGFDKVVIAPQLGHLKSANCVYPHQKGTISIQMNIDKKGALTGMINLPATLVGSFMWKGKNIPLQQGTQTLKIE